jgi:hypothetical protein
LLFRALLILSGDGRGVGFAAMRFSLPKIFSLVLCLAALGWSGRPHAQVHRCTLPDGTALYTDRACATVGAADRVPRTGAGTVGVRTYRGGCARNLQDLVYEMTTAIDASDVNRLAGVYDWVGASSSSAATLMDRLDLVAQRPLVDIVPVTAGTPAADRDDPMADLYPQTTVRRPPVALRVEQTLANGSTPSRTVFGLRRYLGCWWITL